MTRSSIIVASVLTLIALPPLLSTMTTPAAAQEQEWSGSDMSDGDLRDLLRDWVRDRPDRRDMLMDLLQERRERRADLTAWIGRMIAGTGYASGSQAGGTMTRTTVGVIAAIGASGCGSGFQADGTMRRTGASAGACGSASRRDAAGTAMSSPEASGTRTTRSSLSFAGAFAVINLAPSCKTEV